MMAYHGPAGTLLQGMNGQSVVQEDGSSKPVTDSLQSPIASQGLFFFCSFFMNQCLICRAILRRRFIEYAWSGSDAEWYVNLAALTDTSSLMCG